MSLYNAPIFFLSSQLPNVQGLDTPGGEYVFDDTSTCCGQVTSSGTRTHWIFDLPWEFLWLFRSMAVFFLKNLIKHLMEEYKL